MKKYSRNVLLLSFCIVMVYCKKDEPEINLGGNFYYIPFQEIIFDVTGVGGNGIFKYEDSLKIPIIFPEITAYKYDSLFIIVQQNFDSIETSYLLRNMLFMPNVYYKYDKRFTPINEKYILEIDSTINSTILYDKYIKKIMTEDEKIRKMIENSKNYYIIDKRRQTIFGPLTKEEFRKIKLGKGIQLEFEN